MYLLAAAPQFSVCPGIFIQLGTACCSPLGTLAPLNHKGLMYYILLKYIYGNNKSANLLCFTKCWCLFFKFLKIILIVNRPYRRYIGKWFHWKLMVACIYLSLHVHHKNRTFRFFKIVRSVVNRQSVIYEIFREKNCTALLTIGMQLKIYESCDGEV